MIPAIPDPPPLDNEMYPPGDYYYSERERGRERPRDSERDRDRYPRDDGMDAGMDTDGPISMDVDGAHHDPPLHHAVQAAIVEDDYHTRPRRSPRTSRHSTANLPPPNQPSPRHEREWGSDDVRMSSPHQQPPVEDHYRTDRRRHSVSSTSRSPILHRDQRDRERDREHERERERDRGHGHGHGYDTRGYDGPNGGSPSQRGLTSSPSVPHGLANIMHPYSQSGSTSPKNGGPSDDYFY